MLNLFIFFSFQHFAAVPVLDKYRKFIGWKQITKDKLIPTLIMSLKKLVILSNLVTILLMTCVLLLRFSPCSTEPISKRFDMYSDEVVSEKLLNINNIFHLDYFSAFVECS